MQILIKPAFFLWGSVAIPIIINKSANFLTDDADKCLFRVK